MYEIVLEDNQDFVLAKVKTLEIAKERVKEMEKTDLYLSKYYNWKKLPKYVIRISMF